MNASNAAGMLGEFWHSMLVQGSLSAFLWQKKIITFTLVFSSLFFLLKTLILKYHKIKCGKECYCCRMSIRRGFLKATLMLLIVQSLPVGSLHFVIQSHAFGNWGLWRSGTNAGQVHMLNISAINLFIPKLHKTQDLKTRLELNWSLTLELSVVVATWKHLVFKTCLWHLEVFTHSITVGSACLLHSGGLVASILIKIFLIPHIAFTVCMRMPFTG